MTDFSEKEIEYLRTQSLGRIASVDSSGQPDAVPVTFQFDGEHINIGGFAPEKTRRHKSVLAGNTKVCLIVDDLASTNPWIPRYLRIYGEAKVIEGESPYLKVTPTVSWSWNVDKPSRNFATPPKKTVHSRG